MIDESHTPPDEATCPERWASLGVAHACSWISHEGDVHRCVCGDVWDAGKAGCRAVPAEPVTAEGLHARMRDAARRAFADRADAEGALLLSTQRNPWEALDDALAAVTGVRDEQMAHLAAQVAALQRERDRLRIEHDSAMAQIVAQRQRAEHAETDRDTNFSVLQRVSKGGWESATELVNERIARKQAESKLTAAKQALYTAQITHIREAGHNRPVVGDCAICRVLTAISRDMPSRPDDPEEIRRPAQATTEETTDES